MNIAAPVLSSTAEVFKEGDEIEALWRGTTNDALAKADLKKLPPTPKSSISNNDTNDSS